MASIRQEDVDSEIIENIERYDLETFKKKIQSIQDFETLDKLAALAESAPRKEEINKRKKELNKILKGTISEKPIREGEKTITVVGMGLCGCQMVENLIYYLNKNNSLQKFYRIDCYLYDLSKDIDEIIERIKSNGAIDWLKINKTGSSEIRIKPTLMDPGAGKIPFNAEVVLRYLKSYEKIARSSINIYTSSLGGGTGSGTTPQLIANLKRQKLRVADVAFSVLTEDSKEEIDNHLYTFPKINKEANIVILFENKVADREFINDKSTQIFEILTSSRNINTLPKAMDFNDFIFRLCDFDEYNEGIVRWFVPFIWPIDKQYEENYEEKPLFRYLDLALNKGCLCRINGQYKCRSAMLFVKGPPKYIKYLHKRNNNEKDKRTPKEIAMDLLGERLNLNPLQILQAYTPDETSNGLNVCLLIYGINFIKLDELIKLSQNDTNTLIAKRRWKNGLKLGIEQMTQDFNLKSIDTKVIEEEYIKKIDELEIKKDFMKLKEVVMKLKEVVYGY